MSKFTFELGLKLKESPITADSICYRPLSWPPTREWVVSMDSNNIPLSRWGDDFWDFSPWVGKNFILDFVGSLHKRDSVPLGTQNQDILRLLTTWIMWGGRGASSWRTLKSRFNRIRRIVALCESEGVIANKLTRHPEILEKVADLYSHYHDKKAVILELDRLNRAEDHIGFTLVDQAGITVLSNKIFNSSEKDTEQTAYIPTRIWANQVMRLAECVEDFLENRQQVEECFHFCIDAYAHNFGTVEAAIRPKKTQANSLPFTSTKHRYPGARTGRIFHGSFESIASKFGITNLLTKWVLPESKRLSVKSLSAYLTLIQYAGLAYIANFTLQRIEEAASLRADCLTSESDPELGIITVIRGETTKTDPDSDARWPTSPSVIGPVKAMRAVAEMRMRCAVARPEVTYSREDLENPYLFQGASEPWAPSRKNKHASRSVLSSYQNLIYRFPLLFDLAQMRITEEDYASARMFTPNLDKCGKFEIGKIWPLAFHQLRRTGAINMFASGLLSDSSIQFVLKHGNLAQSIYYGRNHTRLRFNAEVEAISNAAKFEVMSKQLEALLGERYVWPAGSHRKQEVVNLIDVKDYKVLATAGKAGEVSFRETRLGGCTKRGPCEYGGIESVVRCAGGDGDKPCRDAVFDRLKASSIKRQLQYAETLLESAQPNSPRENAIKMEKQGMRNYLEFIRP